MRSPSRALMKRDEKIEKKNKQLDAKKRDAKKAKADRKLKKMSNQAQKEKKDSTIPNSFPAAPPTSLANIFIPQEDEVISNILSMGLPKFPGTTNFPPDFYKGWPPVAGSPKIIDLLSQETDPAAFVEFRQMMATLRATCPNSSPSSLLVGFETYLAIRQCEKKVQKNKQRSDEACSHVNLNDKHPTA